MLGNASTPDRQEALKVIRVENFIVWVYGLILEPFKYVFYLWATFDNVRDERVTWNVFRLKLL